MTDNISRADAIEAIQNAYCKPCKERGDDHNEVRCRACAFDDAIIQIDALPSAEAVQGEWKHTITAQPYCSNCEYVFGEDEEFSPFWNYCPMCGAKMKDGDDE